MDEHETSNTQLQTCNTSIKSSYPTGTEQEQTGRDSLQQANIIHSYLIFKGKFDEKKIHQVIFKYSSKFTINLLTQMD